MSVVVTGIGAVTPAGTGLGPLWEGAREGAAHVTAIDRFDASAYACPAAGQSGFDADAELPSRFVKRTDRFTHLAVHAVRQALDEAGVAIGTDVTPERTGVMVGNILGGWEFAERELRNLWTDGPRAVSPYQATAWFPAAPQGNICIDQGVKGPARTFVADRASGAYALIGGAEALLRDRVDVVIAGGVEAPLSPYGWLCLETSGLGAKARGTLAPDELYRPFDAGHGGSVFGEGAVFLILERREHAERRGATILGELAGWGVSTDGYMPYYTVEPTGQVLGRAMRTAADRAGVSGGDLGAVFAHGSAIPFEDVTEGYALHEAFGPAAARVPVTVPKSGFGHLLGAAAPADVALALRGMREETVPATVNLDRPAPGIDLDLVRGEARPAPGWEHTLVVSRGLGGVNACLVLRR
ncbi:beta-ketoacyl synthase [Streptomyces caelestis]|uniref:Beta-ketoacyl synthase n=2 Tax=Streptomyces TaxID=1883 RepID=A0A0M9X928_9ACTN|nr:MULTISPECIES: beta-ketoacyl-[acyl-carrier-protein] synthase family protein [Streptomyces]KOT39824.1 beta-ketoacyl synthase [Streptomyces caelestis]KOV34677.1 beta-ketoacyl synthase [Streptomyces sp. XY152]